MREKNLPPWFRAHEPFSSIYLHHYSKYFFKELNSSIPVSKTFNNDSCVMNQGTCLDQLGFTTYFNLFSFLIIVGFLAPCITLKTRISVIEILYIIIQDKQTACRYILVLVGICSHSLNAKGFNSILPMQSENALLTRTAFKGC